MLTCDYLPLCHNKISETIYEPLRRPEDSNAKIKCNEYEFAHKEVSKQYWWNIPIKTVSKMRHNKRYLSEWSNQQKTCKIIKVSCSEDVNVMLKISENKNIYRLLMRHIQLINSDLTFWFLPIIIYALGTVPEQSEYNLSELSFTEKEKSKLIQKMQMQAIRFFQFSVSDFQFLSLQFSS